jgi:hypothetical protein
VHARMGIANQPSRVYMAGKHEEMKLVLVKLQRSHVKVCI